MGQIRKRGKYYQIRYYRNGQRIEESTGFTAYEDARDELRKREGQVSDGVPVTARSVRLTFGDAVKDVEEDYRIKGQKSLGHLQRRLTLHLTPVFGMMRLSKISASELRAFAARRLEAGASPAEINRELAIVRRAFRLAIKSERYHGRVPAFPMMAEQNVRTGFFDRDAVDSVLAHLPAALRPVIQFAAIVGWRIPSEVLGLEWRQVDRDAGTVRLDVGTTKNKRGRHINFADNQVLVSLFDEQWRQREALKKAQREICPYVFHRDGKRIKDFRGAWKAACKAAGVPGRLPHDLRRTAVRNLVRSGVPDSVAMKVTGHRTRAVFDRYDITSEADLREALGRVDQPTGTNRGDNRGPAKADANKQSA